MMNKFNSFMNVVRDSLQYSFVEVGYLTLVLIDKAGGNGVTEFTLILGAVLAAFWVTVSFSSESVADAKELVLARELFMTDFLVSAFVLTLIAMAIWGEEWYYPAIMLAAVGQNLRYCFLAMRWLLEERREERRRGS